MEDLYGLLVAGTVFLIAAAVALVWLAGEVRGLQRRVKRLECRKSERAGEPINVVPTLPHGGVRKISSEEGRNGIRKEAAR